MARLRGYYRQFEALSEEEVNAGKRVEAQERRARELARVEPLDLARTTWPEYPPPSVVGAITYAARRGLHRYADRQGSALRSELGARLGLPADRVVIGDGSARLLGAATQALMDPGDELVTPFPSYGLYPVMARAARGRAVPVPGFGVEAVLRAVTPHTRVVALCNPNDPTGELLPVEALRALLGALPERAVVLLDEALRDFVTSEAPDAALGLLEEFPRLLVFRTFSKAWGLAGLRVGYALGGPGSEPLLASLEAELGLDELSQAGVLEALRSLPTLARDRGRLVASQREELRAALVERGLDVAPSQANVLWVAAPSLEGTRFALAIERSGIVVAPGGPLGDSERVRITVPHRPEQLVRLLAAVDAVR